MTRLLLLILPMAVSALVVANDARAWEADVHYGLTKWLALQAGYTPQHAEWVAAANLKMDGSLPVSPVFATVLGGCLGFQDAVASGTVRRNHFPSRTGVPDTPQARAVEADRVFDETAVRSIPQVAATESTMTSLGGYLHALQDSWSHQGRPDIPPTCNSAYAWGHPVDRGGWLCHIADQTYRWHDTDVPDMARRTYEVLRGAWPSPNAKPWSQLEAKVRDFAKAESKRGKDAWFRAEGFVKRDFVLHTSLPDCDAGDRVCTPMHYQDLLDGWQRSTPATKAVIAPNVPDDVRTLYARFFEHLVEQRDGAMRELMDMQAVSASYAQASRVNEPCPGLFPKVHKLSLGSGFLDGSGAQQPRAICERLTGARAGKRADLSCSDALQGADESVLEAQIRGPGLDAIAPDVPRSQKYFYRVTARTPQTYVAFARFIHLPSNMLIVGATRTGTRVAVTSVLWAPIE